jgi:uncharacterized protein YkwD
MNPQAPLPKEFKIALAITIVVFIVWTFFLARPQTVDDIKSFFPDTSPQGILNTVERTVTNSGKLIANVDFSNAYLTNSGTIALTNNERAKAGLPTLVSNAKLMNIAKIRMNDMFAKGYFEHISSTGDSAAKEADANGYAYITIGENIAMGNFKDDATLMQAWMNSPGHRANILRPTFTQLGVSVGKGMYNGKETWIAVQVFGKPLSSCPTVDTNLKSKINVEQSQVDSGQAQLAQIKTQLDTMATDPNVDGATYNQKIDEFNTLVTQINALISEVKVDIANYNVTVQAFNVCLASDSQ